MDRNVRKRTESKCQTYGVKKKKKTFQNGPKSFLSRTKLRESVGNAEQSIFILGPIELSEQKDKLVTATVDTEKYFKKQSLVKFCTLVLKILSGNVILTSIKGRNSVANL